MQAVSVSGVFVWENRTPVEGMIGFYPEKLWIVEGGVPLATMAHEVPLVEGQFEVPLSVVPYGTVKYRVVSPVGAWSIEVAGNKPLFLKDLLPKYVRGT